MTLAALVIGIGNLSRGDDALGHRVLDALEAEALPDTAFDCLPVFQLQPEHALDLVGRPGVLIVDAARADHAPGVQLTRLQPSRDASWTSHALSPAALLQLCLDLHAGTPQAVPPVWLLSVAGDRFELGDDLSAGAEARLVEAVDRARQWCRDVSASILAG